MGFWEFMTVAVVFGSFFGWLTFRNVLVGRRRVAALERRLTQLERDRSDTELAQRVDVLEEIVVGDDAPLRRRIRDADLADRVAALEASRQVARVEEVEGA